MRARVVFGRVVASLATVASAACGSGGTRIEPIYQGVVGPAGGNVATTTVSLDLPPGALAGPVPVRIMPQPTPLPIDPSAGSVDTMPGLMCIGPVGQDLLVPATVKFCYDPATLPAGAKLSDLVLLEFDNALGTMKVSQTATHDVVTHCFTDIVYGQLGHIGVGLRKPPLRNFVFAANGVPPPLRTTGLAAGFPDGSLVVGSDTGEADMVALPNTGNADLYVPSRDGAQVLFHSFDNSSESQSLRACDSTDGTTLFTANPSLSLSASDPLFGWFADPRHLFYAHNVPDFSNQTFSIVDDLADATIDEAGNEHLHDGPTNFTLIDIRLSPDGSRAILRYQDFNFGTHRVDTVDVATGNAIGTDLAVLPFGTNSPMPRWLPDSSGLYFPSGGNTVARVDADGGNPGTLYTATGRILDFVLAPSASLTSPGTARCAYFRAPASVEVPPQSPPAAIISFGNTSFCVDVLAGTAFVAQDLGSAFSIFEMAYHPDGRTVLAQMSSNRNLGSTGPKAAAIVLPIFGTFVAAFDAASAATNRAIQTTFGDLDVSRTSGEILVWMPSPQQDVQFPTEGIWRLEADGTGGTLVDTTGVIVVGPPRMLSSWRTACCASGNPFVR